MELPCEASAPRLAWAPAGGVLVACAWERAWGDPREQPKARHLARSLVWLTLCFPRTELGIQPPGRTVSAES